MYYIYMLRCSDDSIYTGITTNVEKRIKEHYYKTKLGAKYTRARTIVAVECIWMASNRSMASKLESQIKAYTKTKKEEIIKQPCMIESEDYIVWQPLNLKDYLV